MTANELFEVSEIGTVYYAVQGAAKRVNVSVGRRGAGLGIDSDSGTPQYINMEFDIFPVDVVTDEDNVKIISLHKSFTKGIPPSWLPMKEFRNGMRITVSGAVFFRTRFECELFKAVEVQHIINRGHKNAVPRDFLQKSKDILESAEYANYIIENPSTFMDITEASSNSGSPSVLRGSYKLD